MKTSNFPKAALCVHRKEVPVFVCHPKVALLGNTCLVIETVQKKLVAISKEGCCLFVSGNFWEKKKPCKSEDPCPVVRSFLPNGTALWLLLT